LIDSERFCAVTTISASAPAESAGSAAVTCCARLGAPLKPKDIANNAGTNALDLRMMNSPLQLSRLFLYSISRRWHGGATASRNPRVIVAIGWRITLSLGDNLLSFHDSGNPKRR
jgi:hypothetical protein